MSKMAKGGQLNYGFFLCIGALLLVVVFIVMSHGGLRSLFGSVEGFSPPPMLESPQCPPGGYKFFNNEQGASFCCKGTLNPYTHQCETSSPSGICAFEPNSPDPRDPKKTLPLCSSIIVDTHAKNQSSCSPSLPNYAMIGKCCAHNPDMDGFDCIPSDNADKNKYCKIKGPLKPGERLCAEVGMLESAVCPTQIPQKINYMTGQKEAQAYGPDTAGVFVPVCFGMNDVCIPDSAISYYQGKNGLYKGKNISNWSYSCSGWANKNVNMDQATKMDTKYL